MELGRSLGGGGPFAAAVRLAGVLFALAGVAACGGTSKRTVGGEAGESATGGTAATGGSGACETCVPATPAGCENAPCAAPRSCASGSTWARPAGACCAGCIPDVPPGCVDIACPSDTCPAGYVSGDGTNGCCYDCVPDPSYCESSTDCMLAVDSRACCGCPQAISTRLYEEDRCWSDPSAPRDLPAECQSSAPPCAASCAPCPFLDVADCSPPHCVGVVLLK